MIDFVDGEQIAAEIKMMRAGFPGTVFIVEGETDQRLLERFINKEACEILCAHGKENVLCAVQVLNRESFTGALGFVDADFDRIDNELPTLSNVVVCDYADSEMMLLLSPALEKTLEQYASGRKCEKILKKRGFNTVRELIINEGMKLASIRYANKSNSWNLRFKGVDYKKIVDERRLVVDMERAIDFFLANSASNLSAEKVKDGIPPSTDSYDEFEFCNGHDCTTLLAVGLRQCLATHSQQIASKENVEKLLRLAYEDSSFSETEVYNSIRSWEMNNENYDVLRPLKNDPSD